MNIRLYTKLLLRRFILLNSFCKNCGREVHDFSAPDSIWHMVEPTIEHGKMLCYDCFCERCQALGLPSVYRLEVL